MASYSDKAISGTAWMFFGSGSQQVIGFLVSIVLARLLVPSDFGAVALILAIITLLQAFSEMGTSVALVQKQNITSSYIDGAFTVNCTLTLFICALLWGGAEKISVFFAVPLLAPLLHIAAVQYFFVALFSLYRCLMLREMRYKELSLLGFASVVSHGAVAISLALRGYGPYSLVWGHLFSAIILFSVGLWRAWYLPKSFGTIREIKELLSFGIWVSLSRFLNNMSGKIDVFIIGKLISISELGGYHLAQKIVQTVPMTYTSIIDQVLLPIYSKWQNDAARIEEGYWKALSYTSILVVPPVFLIFTFSGPLVNILIGEKWIQIIPIIKIMSIFGLSHGLGGGIFGAVIYAMNKPKVVTIVSVFRLVALPACVLVGSIWGVVGVAWGFSIYGVIGRIFNQYLMKAYFSFSMLRYLKEIALALFSGIFATVTALVLLLFLANYPLFPEVAGYLVALLFWFGTYYFGIRIFDREKSDFMINTASEFIFNINKIVKFGMPVKPFK